MSYFLKLNLASIVMYKLTAKWIARCRLVYLTTILWLPFSIIFTFLFASIFPITNQGDSPAPVQGLILFAMIFFILIQQNTPTSIGGEMNAIFFLFRGRTNAR